MGDTVIQVEGLGKRYLIRHLQDRHPKVQGYNTLRDVLAEHVRNLFTKRTTHNAQRTPFNEDFWALKDVSFEVKQGERIGIIGRNGAGKSTLLKILSRVTEPTRGRVRIKGRVASLLEVGTGFHPELTGRENVFLNGAVLGMTKVEIKKKFDEIVAFAEVEKFLDTPVKRYSSGMYVRLAFAVAAHLEPEILVVDEVLAVGDAAFQKKCLGKMQDVAEREGRTVLFVSHNMQVVQALCRHGIWLERGEISFQGKMSAVVANYLSKNSLKSIERVWPNDGTAPGNNKVRLLSAKAIPNLESSADPITVRTPLNLEFVYQLLVPEALFYVGIHLKTVYGECAFVAGSTPNLTRGGNYRTTCHIPGNLLNDGTYTVHIYFVRDGQTVLFEMADLITIEVHDVERDSGAFLGSLPGAVRPKLLWDSERIGNPCMSDDLIETEPVHTPQTSL